MLEETLDLERLDVTMSETLTELTVEAETYIGVALKHSSALQWEPGMLDSHNRRVLQVSGEDLWVADLDGVHKLTSADMGYPMLRDPGTFGVILGQLRNQVPNDQVTITVNPGSHINRQSDKVVSLLLKNAKAALRTVH